MATTSDTNSSITNQQYSEAMKTSYGQDCLRNSLVPTNIVQPVTRFSINLHPTKSDEDKPVDHEGDFQNNGLKISDFKISLTKFGNSTSPQRLAIHKRNHAKDQSTHQGDKPMTLDELNQNYNDD